MNLCVQTKALTREYITPVGKHCAVRQMTFALPAQSITCILGPNGAGKTTLLKLLATLLAPTSGTAFIAGQEIRPVNHHTIRRSLGYAGQNAENSFYGHLTGQENLLYCAKTFHSLPNSAYHQFTQVVAEHCSSDVILRKHFSEMSGGEKQLLVLLRALIHKPRFVILDEPTRSLDPATVKGLHQLLRTVSRETGATFLISTHDLHEAEALSDHVLFIKDGKLGFCGTKEDFKALAHWQHVITCILGKNTEPSDFQRFVEALKNNGLSPYSNQHLSIDIVSTDTARDILSIARIIASLSLSVVISSREASVEDAYANILGGGNNGVK